jgi:antirestriction protein ArdC
MQEAENSHVTKRRCSPKHRERSGFTISNNENTASDQRDVYVRVTSQIINSIEAGVSNWRMPWHTSGKFAFSPINVTSKKPYRGINTVCLWAAAQAKQYERGEWGTYQQWQERGAQVRRGEKATLVVSGNLRTAQPIARMAKSRPGLAVHGCYSLAATRFSMRRIAPAAVEQHG